MKIKNNATSKPARTTYDKMLLSNKHGNAAIERIVPIMGSQVAF